MEYGQGLSRAWNVIWEHKFLILLGVLVALGSAGGGSGITTGSNFAGPRGERGFQLPPGRSPWEFFDQPGLPLGVPAALGIAVAVVVLILAVLLWTVSALARGGLVAGVHAIDAGRTSDFGQAWREAWRRGWRLLGIAVIPAIPALAALLLGIAVFVLGAGTVELGSSGIELPSRTVWVTIMLVVFLVALPVALVLSALRALANRAAIIEDLGVFAAYGRGLAVLFDNIGPALLLLLIQIGLSLGVGLILLLPTIVIALCCILWPLLLLVQGAIAAYFSAMWTLAWRRWTSPISGGPGELRPELRP
jgi:hypothetical protein